MLLCLSIYFSKVYIKILEIVLISSKFYHDQFVYWANRQNLITRLNNHNIDSPLQQETDVAKHQVDNSNHKIDFNNCAILGFSNHWRKLLIKELLYIRKFNPSMNIDKKSIPLYLFNT